MSKGHLLAIHPDGSTNIIKNEYQAIRDAIGNWIDFVHGAGPTGAFIDDEGMLSDQPLNVVGSIALGRAIYGTVVLTSNESDDEGNTMPPTEEDIRVFTGMGNIWRMVIASAEQVGQDIMVRPVEERIPPPTVVSMSNEQFEKWLETGEAPT